MWSAKKQEVKVSLVAVISVLVARMADVAKGRWDAVVGR